jgi:hypothetical protein
LTVVTLEQREALLGLWLCHPSFPYSIGRRRSIICGESTRSIAERARLCDAADRNADEADECDDKWRTEVRREGVFQVIRETQRMLRERTIARLIQATADGPRVRSARNSLPMSRAMRASRTAPGKNPDVSGAAAFLV